jgi:hypothetical protein
LTKLARIILLAVGKLFNGKCQLLNSLGEALLASHNLRKVIHDDLLDRTGKIDILEPLPANRGSSINARIDKFVFVCHDEGTIKELSDFIMLVFMYLTKETYYFRTEIGKIELVMKIVD